MKSFTFRAAWGLGLALFWSSPLTAADKQGDLMQLRVSVFNSASISPKAIEHAEGEASRILEDAGVAVIWLNCPQDSQHEVSRGRCTEASFPLHLHLRIARVSRGLKPSTVGISFSAEDGQGCYEVLVSVADAICGRKPRCAARSRDAADGSVAGSRSAFRTFPFAADKHRGSNAGSPSATADWTLASAGDDTPGDHRFFVFG